MQSPAAEKRSDGMAIERLDADLLVPAALHDAGDTGGVVAIAFVDLHFQGGLGVPGIDANDGQPALVQLGPKPRRCRPWRKLL